MFLRLNLQLYKSASATPRTRAASTTPVSVYTSIRKIHQSRPLTMYESMTKPQTNGHTNGTAPGSKARNAWQAPSQAAFDFRSDTLTTPTEAMLEAIKNTTLFDDVYGEDTTTNDLEHDLAVMAGHTHGLLVMSGTMGNQVAIRSHLTHPPHSVACDIRAHVHVHEAGGVSTLSGALMIAITPRNNHHLTLADVQQHVIISDNVHYCPTRVISLENTLNGLVMPLDELRRIAAWAHENNIKVHLDGARIWEAVASGAGSLKEFCSAVDSVTMCFSKGLGAPVGSLLVGDEAFITQARRIRKMFGGGIRQAGVLSAAARVGVETVFGKDEWGTGGLLKLAHERARKVGEGWERRGGKLTWPVETNMAWLDLKVLGVSDAEFAQLADKEQVTARGGRVVVHYQIADEALVRLERVLDRVVELAKEKGTFKAS